MIPEPMDFDLRNGSTFPPPRRAIIVALSSDIGSALARRWLGQGWQVCGTYRNKSKATEQLGNQAALVQCDLADVNSVTRASQQLFEMGHGWDALVLCPGTLEPVGPFIATCFDDWEKSLRVNFTSPLRLVHDLLPLRNRATKHGAGVLFFAGSGTNGPALNYSVYTAGKIGLIKMCELLDAEVADARFTILGTGWVRTKIHEATLRAGARAGDNYQRVVQRLSGEDWTPMERVLDCCDWAISAPRAVVSGRNFSVVNDRWGAECLEKRLTGEPEMYKLRRSGNNWLPAGEPAPTTEGRA
jgi:NAD(P)-dependent dehydrogenase (short-subunit alcohol dehydrogenase family)